MKEKSTHIITELKDLKAEQLLSLKKELKYDYFIELEKNINNDIDKLETKKSKSLFIPFSLAASLLLFFSFYFISNTNDTSLTWEEIKNEDLAYYISENIEDFSSEEITSLSNQEELSYLFSTSITNMELENYLLDQTIDESEFVNY